jgi:hypothetical protein
MKRLFWVGVGVAVGVTATRKVNEFTQKATPAGIGTSLGEGLRELGAGLGAFGAEVRAGMTEREQELTDLVERRTGAPLPAMRDAFADPEPTPARRPAPRARARRAGA